MCTAYDTQKGRECDDPSVLTPHSDRVIAPALEEWRLLNVKSRSWKMAEELQGACS